MVDPTRPTKAERDQIAAQVQQLTTQGILPAEQRRARVALARGARSHEDLQHALDPNFALPAQVGQRGVLLAVLAALIVLGVGMALFAAGAPAP